MAVRLVSESSAENSVIEQIDFSKYKTPELVKSISELVSISGKIQQVFFTAVLGALVFFVGTALLGYYQLRWETAVVLCIYATMAGFSAGTAFGIARTIRKSAKDALKVIDLLLEETCIIAADVQALSGGEQKMPPPAVLIDAVYHRLVFPIASGVLKASLGMMATPVIWLYRKSMDRAVKLVIKRYVPEDYEGFMEEEQETTELQQTQTAAKTIVKVSDNKDKIVGTLTGVRGKVQTVTSFMVVVFAWPAYAFAFVILFVTLLPIGMTWYFSGIKVPGEDVQSDRSAMHQAVPDQRIAPLS